MEKFYAIYYLVLFLIYTLLPGLFWLFGAKKSDNSPEGRITHHKSQQRGHAIVSIVLSAVMLSFLPLVISSMKKGDDVWLNGVFILVFVGAAGFFLWIGAMGIKMNRRSLREAQAKLDDRDDK